MIGRDGRIVHFSMGATEWDSPGTIEMVKSFIAESAPAPAAQQASLVTASASGADLGPSSH